MTGATPHGETVRATAAAAGPRRRTRLRRTCRTARRKR